VSSRAYGNSRGNTQAVSIPLPLSTGEETFALHCNIYHIEVEREFRFHETRHWRFDFAIPDLKIGIEIEGTTYAGGRHQRVKGYAEDCLKYNTAVLLGWRVLRFPTSMVISGKAIDDLRALIAK
jgi:very-short-patch-repair endonuclease